MATTSVPSAGLQSAQTKDDFKDKVVDLRSHLEFGIVYTAFAGELVVLNISMEGMAIISFYMEFLPTFLGSFTSKSLEPVGVPSIDPSFLATEADRLVMCEGRRQLSRLMFKTPDSRDLVVDEIVP